MIYDEILLIWRSTVWQVLIASFVAGVIAALIASLIETSFGYPQPFSQWALIIGTLAALPTSLRVVKFVINKHGLRKPN